MPIRQLLSSERDEWLRMRRALWPDCDEAMHALEMGRYFSQPDTRVVLVFDCGDGRPGGFAEVSVRDRVEGSYSERVGYLEGWYVDEDLRGRGVGRQLVAAAEAWALSRGLTEMASDAEIENEGSIRAHHALGFRETFRVVQFLKALKRDDCHTRRRARVIETTRKGRPHSSS